MRLRSNLSFSDRRGVDGLPGGIQAVAGVGDDDRSECRRATGLSVRNSPELGGRSIGSQISPGRFGTGPSRRFRSRLSKVKRSGYLRLSRRDEVGDFRAWAKNYRRGGNCGGFLWFCRSRTAFCRCSLKSAAVRVIRRPSAGSKWVNVQVLRLKDRAWGAGVRRVGFREKKRKEKNENGKNQTENAAGCGA